MAELIKFSKRQTQALAAAPVEQRAQYLAFTLGQETFAMDIRSIREVIQFGGVTEVPLMPPFIRGVINLRGSVVPVIDLLVRFGRPAATVAQRACIVILELVQEECTAELGILVDNVSEVLSIAASEVEPAPTFGSDLRTEFLAGVARVNDHFVILLDVNHVLSVEELAALVDRNQARSSGIPLVPAPGETHGVGQTELGLRPVPAGPSQPEPGATAPSR
ncbi:MAG: chemotaxis protein CheW [Holophaga sp.]|nr:chemotaxis protein CheW [Holophaga sp.]